MKIVILGDSYAYGDGCADVKKLSDRPSYHSWPSLLQRARPQLTVVNVAQPGADNLSILAQLWQNWTQDIDIIIFAASMITRVQGRHPANELDETRSLSPHFGFLDMPTEYKVAVKNYYQHLYSDLVGVNHAVCCILAGYGCSQLLGADFYWSIPNHFDPGQFPNWDRLNTIRDRRILACPDLGYGPDQLAVCGHPNELGYAKYHDSYFLSFIDNIITQKDSHAS